MTSCGNYNVTQGKQTIYLAHPSPLRKESELLWISLEIESQTAQQGEIQGYNVTDFIKRQAEEEPNERGAWGANGKVKVVCFYSSWCCSSSAQVPQIDYSLSSLYLLHRRGVYLGGDYLIYLSTTSSAQLQQGITFYTPTMLSVADSSPANKPPTQP